MSTLPAAPPEVPINRSLTECAPLFRAAVLAVLRDMTEQGLPTRLVETVRTAERQSYLYGFGRRYDDGRGVVTRARTHLTSWHGYGLAADLVHAARWWSASPAYWAALGATAERHGLAWGGRWTRPDRPHVQWGRCRRRPSAVARQLLQDGGLTAVWSAVRAT